jgi:hypothetical protein
MAQKSGIRHPLLMYRRTTDRVGVSTFFFGLILGGAWGWSDYSSTPLFHVNIDLWLFVGAVVCLAISAFAFLARYMAYAQVHAGYLSIVTPFLRLNVSYRRVRNIHPALIKQLFPPEKSKWAQNSYLEPFLGKTAVVIETKGYPMDPFLLRLFLPSQMFSPQTTGLVILVPDWMKFSTEIDSFQGSWLQTQSNKSRTNLPGRI